MLIVRALTAVLNADSKSALGITMNASLPPSSSTLFLISRAAALATAAPAFSLPVTVTAFTRAIDDQFFHLLRLDQQRLENAVFKSGAAKDFFNRKRALRTHSMRA